ncbi:hypothetical protein NQ176_g10276 [Zarea fungicola]|uniref:Uncharacterized protein n=1 Tax=Zarea fungicola TaxID=93591 RepID=A0ACC1MHF6_9HYPO|nr:hypothetical protein NQ176_g10276 [Lecanicillium fungicola]
MAAQPWAALPFGIGTMEIHKGYLYWINTFMSTFYRIPIDSHGYVPANAKSEKYLALRVAFVDGFTFGPRGGDTIWAVTNADSRLLAITPDKKVTFLAGSPDQLTLGGCTMPRFGQRHGDERTLYIVTYGSLLLPVNGTLTEGGKLVSVDTTGVLC